MTTTTLLPATPAAPPANPFPPAPELAAQLRGLHDAQVEVDRRRAEELARLRAVQDRD